MKRGSLVRINIAGKGDHPAIVLDVNPEDSNECLVISGTSKPWPGVERIEVDPQTPRHRVLGSKARGLSWTTYFHATAIHRVAASSLSDTGIVVPLRLVLELRDLVGRAG